jgi:hypothetical protein
MSQQLISRNPDLQRLRDDGYDVGVRANHLVLNNVPYVTAQREIKRGKLVSELTMAGDRTTRPKTHVIMFAGEYPCDRNGAPIEKIRHGTARQVLSEGMVVDHSFSNKPEAGYQDYYDKMSRYAIIISGPAESLDPSMTPRTYPVIVPEEDESVFQYFDTASSRAGITAVSAKLAGHKIAIIGVGGTGSYILDQAAKTPAGEIHLFDGDTYLTHNAFRSPGATSVEDLRQAYNKAAYFAAQYSRMHRHIIPHPYYLDATNVDELRGMSFVFLALDKGTLKRLIIEKLEECGIPFIDVGMGVNLVEGALLGVLRVTTSTAAKRDHVREKQRIPFTDGDGNNEYDQNIQIADLNALNATLAVIKWKKHCGFYHDLEHEHFTTYTIDGGTITNEDQP